jgi:hypothetical protein
LEEKLEEARNSMDRIHCGSYKNHAGGHPAVEEPEAGALVRLYIQQLTNVSQWV